VSTHEVRVVRIPTIQKHPNADKLGLVEVNGFTVVVGLESWKEGDLAAYIEPDYVVPETEAFAFLGRHTRIKTKKIRGVWSMGLLTPAPEGAVEGECVMERMGVVRYEPSMVPFRGQRKGEFVPADNAPPPQGIVIPGKYDLENLRKNWDAFVEGEYVVVTEKIHGANARYVFDGEKMHLGSRTRWVQDDGLNVWSRALRACPWIEELCRLAPGSILYGEVFGRVQDLNYGLGDAVDFRHFDCTRTDRCATGWEDAVICVQVEFSAPVLYVGPFSKKKMLELAEGDSAIEGAKHIREGIVVKPAFERLHKGDRCAFKLVSNAYLSR
jgi:RNA ligase (TIGR02306 family)